MINIICRILLGLMLIIILKADCQPSHCNSCSSDYVCSSCDSGYFKVGSICCHNSCTNCTKSGVNGICTSCVNPLYGIHNTDQRCYICSSYMTNCLTCTNQYTCTLCAATYAFNSSQCKSCSILMSGCFNCSSSTVCTQCANDTLFVSTSTNKCVTCLSVLDGCSNCDSSTVCTACANDTFVLNLDTDRCVTCGSVIVGCSTCSSNLSCLTCVNNSLAINASSLCAVCSTMLADCLTCNSSSICTSCTSNLVALDPSTNKCVSCQSLLTACSSCNSSTICINCANTSFALLTATNRCDACQSIMVGCLTCQSQIICLTCVNNSYAVNSTSMCAPCSTIMTDCLTCDSSSICSSCVNDTVTVDPSTSKCATCLSLLTGCSNCNSSTICIMCIDSGFALHPSTNQCILCPQVLPYCSNCSSITECTTCMNTSFAINSTFGCQSCNSLIPYCLYCSSSNVCTDCINNNYVVNSTSKLCVLCSGYLTYCSQCSSTSVCTTCEVSNPNVILYNNSCVKCGVVIPSCLNCTSGAICTVCDKYYLVTSGACTLCRSIMSGCIECLSTTNCTYCVVGHIVINGCSQVPGCIAIVNNYPLSTCSACDEASYYPQPTSSGGCKCFKGHLAGQYCTEIIGCTKINRIGSVDTCTACDTSKKFELKNGTCLCEPNYQLIGQTCSQICGDGKLIYLACDDGNLINGDGCSSTCQIQKSYACSDGTISTASKCIYKGLVKLQYVCAYKLDDNVASIILTTTPFVSNILKSQLNIEFNLSKNYSLTSTSYDGQNIVLQINYQQNIEGEIANITLQYDHNYIVSPDSSIAVKLTQCNGDRFYYTTDTSKGTQFIINIIIRILTFLVMVVWLVGSYSHKMIGVETLHTFQFISISQTLAPRYLPVVTYFSDLSNTLNIYQSKLTSQEPISTKPQSLLNYTAGFVYNNSVVALIQLVALGLYAALFFYGKFKRSQEAHEKQKTKRTKKQQKSFIFSNVSKLKQFIYDFLLFPAFIGFFLNFALSLMIHSNASNEKKTNLIIQTIVILCSICCTSMIFFNEWKYFFLSKKRNTNHKQSYVPFFLTNFIFACFIIEASILSLIPNPLMVQLALFVIYTVLLIAYRPYHHHLHNISLIINQIGVIINLCWIISQQIIYLPRQSEQMIALFLIFWMLLILVFAIVRIIYQICQKRNKTKERKRSECSKNNVQEYNEDVKKIINSMIRQNLRTKNAYLVESQLLSSKLLEERQFQFRRNQQILHLNKSARLKNLQQSQSQDHQQQIKINALRKALKISRPEQQQ